MTSARVALGLLGVLAVGAACTPSRAAAPDSVRLTIRHSRFVPSSFSAAPGTTVRIVVHNTDPIEHELIVGDQATQDRHEHGVEAHHDSSVPGEVSVPAGATVETTYRFSGPGDLLYGCHLPGHWAYGMRGTITVV